MFNIKNFTCSYCQYFFDFTYINYLNFSENNHHSFSCTCKNTIYDIYSNGIYIFYLQLPEDHQVQIYYENNLCYKFYFIKYPLDDQALNTGVTIIFDLNYEPDNLNYQNPFNLIKQLNSFTIFK